MEDSLEEPFLPTAVSSPLQEMFTGAEKTFTFGKKNIKKTKKKKKFSSILSNMLKASAAQDVSTEEDIRRKGLGGGAFEKVVKI
jgi:hypothetical protein